MLKVLCVYCPLHCRQLNSNHYLRFPVIVHNRGLGIDFDVDMDPEYDVFISHASEDKDEVVRPLAERFARQRNKSMV